MIHPQAGQAIQPQRIQTNGHTNVPPAHPHVHNSRSFPPRSEAKEQPQQCRDKEECRWRHDPTSQASPLRTLPLSQPHNYTTQAFLLCYTHLTTYIRIPVIFLSGTKIYLVTKVEEASLLVPTELGKGVESLLEQDSKPNRQVVPFTLFCINPSYWQEDGAEASGFKVLLGTDSSSG